MARLVEKGSRVQSRVQLRDNGNIANHIHRFLIDHGKFILIKINVWLNFSSTLPSKLIESERASVQAFWGFHEMSIMESKEAKYETLARNVEYTYAIIY